MQDSPPGAAVAAALAARPPSRPGGSTAPSTSDRSAVALYNARHRDRRRARRRGRRVRHGDGARRRRGLRAIVGPALPDRKDEGFAEPVELAVEAIAEALDGTVLSRDDLHEALRRRLPGELLPGAPAARASTRGAACS